MKKTIKKIFGPLNIIIIILIGISLIVIPNRFNKPVTPPEPSPIDLIMQEPLFKETMLNEATRIYTQRKKEAIELKTKQDLEVIEKEFEQIRKKELELIASSTPVSLKE